MVMGRMTSFRSLALSSCAAFALTISSAGLASADGQRATDSQAVEFQIPAQSLPAALSEFARQSGRQLLFAPDIAVGKTSNAVAGALDPLTAFARLIAGSGLTYSLTASGAILLRDPLRAAAANAADGRAEAADSGEPAEGGQQRSVEKVVVTGTHIRGIAPKSTPTESFDREEIVQSGAPNLPEFMRTIPQNFSGGTQDENRGDGSSGLGGSSANLRGFGENRTLVLLNGHRIAPSGQNGNTIDISIIPVAALERLEIVTVGASSIYGSDAVGGVVNLMLRNDFEGAETGFSTGTLTQGGGTTYNFNQALGDTWGSGNALVVYDYFDQSSFFARDRDFTGPSIAQTELIPNISRHSLFVNGRQELGAGTELFADAFYVDAHNERKSNFAFLNWHLNEVVDSEFYGATGGLRQDLGGTWQGSFVATYSQSEQNRSAYHVATGVLEASSGLSSDFASDATILEGKIDGDLFDIGGGAVKLALGAQYRDETLTRLDTNRTMNRDVHSAFAELYVPLVRDANAVPGIDRLELTASGRFEDFGEFSSLDPQVGLLWRPVSSLALRGNWGTSFSVANQSDASAAPAAFLFAVPDSGAVTANPITLLLFGADPNLGVEESEYHTLGFDYSPDSVQGLRVGATYFDISLTGALSYAPFPSSITDPAVAPFVIAHPTAADISAALAFAGLTNAQFTSMLTSAGRTLANVESIYHFWFTNLAERHSTGLDLSARYDTSTDFADLWFSANASYLFEYSLRASSTSPELNQLDRPFQPLDLRVRLGAGLTQGSFSASAFVNYADNYTDRRGATPDPVESFTTVDASFAWNFDSPDTWLHDVRLQLSAQNLFDQEPPHIGSASPNFGGDQGYDSFNASARGRYVSVSIRKQF